jgi:hypothetical protein
MRRSFANPIFRLTGHRLCCGRIPEWTAHVGQPWRPFDEAPLNLYNLVWRVQVTLRGWMD